MKFEKSRELWRAVKFTLFSISAGLIEIGSFTLLTEFTNWSYWPRYLTALLLSVLLTVFLNPHADKREPDAARAHASRRAAPAHP